MSLLQRVLLLLSIAVLLREGSSGSTFSFLRDIKNRLFLSSNTTSATSTDPCSGHEQEGVCALQNTTTDRGSNESIPSNKTETSGTTDVVNGTEELENNSQLMDQFAGNITVTEDTYNTNYTQDYDEQDWNSTASNNTGNYVSEVEYSEIGQNDTNYSEVSMANGDETNNQTEGERSKRDVNEIAINITLKPQGVSTTKPLTLNTTVLTSKIEKASIIVAQNHTTDLSGNTLKVNDNDTIGVRKKQNPNVAKADGNNSVKTIMIGNKTEENKDKQVTNEVTNTTLDRSTNLETAIFNETMDKFSEPLNSIEAVGEENTNTTVNNVIELSKTGTTRSSVTDVEANATIENLQPKYNSFINQTELISSINKALRDIENITNNSKHLDVTKLQAVLNNSSQIIEKIVKDITAAVSSRSSNVSQTTLENIQINTMTQEMKNDQYNSSRRMLFNYPEMNSNKQNPNSITDLKNGNDENYTEETALKNDNSTFGDLNERINTETSLDLDNSTVLNSSDISNVFTHLENKTLQKLGVPKVKILPENSTTGRREKRSITFTIGVDVDDDDDDEGDEAIHSPTPPMNTDDNPKELLLNVTLNATETDSWNETTEVVKIVGPVCFRRYEQCKNNSECCENNECIGIGENSKYYCDLRPINSSVSTSQPITTNKEDLHSQ